MRLSQVKHHLLRNSAASLACLLLFGPAASAQQMPTFANQYKDQHIDPNSRFVSLPTGIADMVALHFTLPKATFNFPLVGLTMFPYYQASPELKEFLNSRVGAVPVTNLMSSVNLNVNYQLPPTDLIRLNIPLAERRIEKTQSNTRMALRGPLRDDVSWLVAHQVGQPFAVPGDNSAVVMASPGTMFNAVAQRTMAIRCGTLWVITGSRPVVVLTKYGAVSVSPFSIAAVEQTWLNKVKTAVLYGKPAEFQFAYKGNSTRTNIDKGKEMTVLESAVASSGASDYADDSSGKAIASALPLTVPNLNISTRNVDADGTSFLNDLKSVNPPLTDLRMANAYQNMFNDYGVTKAMRQDAARRHALRQDIASKEPSAYKASLDDRYFVPAYKPVRSCIPVIFPRVNEPLKALWGQHGVVKYLESSKIDVEHTGRLEMADGEALFVATEPMTVRANECIMQIADGAIVQVICKKDFVAIRNLKEVGHESVKLRIRSRALECSAGNEVVVATTMPTIYAEMKRDGITRRNMRTIEMAGGNVVVNMSEIDMTSLMQYSPSMRQLIESKDQYDQKLVGQVVKMDAVLSVTTKGHGSYQRMAGIPSTR